MASITLTRFSSVAHSSSLLPRQCAWPIIIAAYGYDMTSSVFVYHVGDGVLQGDIFEVVASPLQLQELPVNKPLPGIPYYRRSLLEFLCRSAEEAQYVWDTVQEEVGFLVRDFNASGPLEATAQVRLDSSSTALAPVYETPTPSAELSHPLSGNGSPEGAVSAGVGETYWDVSSNHLWVKDSGNSNTGWIMIQSSVDGGTP